ncbi:MAG: Hsp20/alpha crystallin family protein [Actinomycetota bacterium]|nr:Hsp20/alpha crystallin family protein [Actinomycetota bacterium]
MLPERRSTSLSRPEPAHFDPFAELDALNQRLRRYLDSWDRFPSLLDGQGLGFTPLADVEETDDAYLVEVELPGVKRNDIDVTLSGRQLTVSGERKEKERTGILRRRTRVTGRFYYEVTLPAADPDAEVSAGYDDGVLTIRVPKPEADRPRRIPVT